MGLPWLEYPLTLHSSRDPGTCHLTPEQCAYKMQYWVNWYQADYRYGLPTIAVFLVAIILFSIGNMLSRYLPQHLRATNSWALVQATARFCSYKTWRIHGWNSESLGTFMLGGVGVIFFFCMALVPRPYYWPNTRTLTYANSPPIATRSGWMATAIMPFVIMLGAKSSPITALTGISYERLNIWHNWASWAMFVLALLHTFPFIVYHIWKGDMVMEWNDGGLYLTGVIALLCQAWLTFLSVPWIRNRYYEFFKATHFLMAAAFVVFFFIHCGFTLTSADYFIATGAFYVLYWLYAQCRTLFEHGTQRRARLTLESASTLKVVLHTRPTTRWIPGQHVFLRFRVLGVHALTAHPFTISSVPRPRAAAANDECGRMVFYVEPRGGVTGRLAKLAEKEPGVAVPVLLDGPYGGLPGRYFAGFDQTLVVAGGAGAGFTLALIEDFLVSAPARSHATNKPPQQQQQQGAMQVIVATRDPHMRAWYLSALEEIVAFADKNVESGRNNSSAAGGKSSRVSIHIYETGQTAGSTSSWAAATTPLSNVSSETREVGDAEKLGTGAAFRKDDDGGGRSSTSAESVFGIQYARGRPDLSAIANGLISSGGQNSSVGMVVCGPSSMVHDMGAVAADAQQRILKGDQQTAKEVWLHLEGFS